MGKILGFMGPLLRGLANNVLTPSAEWSDKNPKGSGSMMLLGGVLTYMGVEPETIVALGNAVVNFGKFLGAN